MPTVEKISLSSFFFSFLLLGSMKLSDTDNEVGFFFLTQQEGEKSVCRVTIL